MKKKIQNQNQFVQINSHLIFVYNPKLAKNIGSLIKGSKNNLSWFFNVYDNMFYSATTLHEIANKLDYLNKNFPVTEYALTT